MPSRVLQGNFHTSAQLRLESAALVKDLQEICSQSASIIAESKARRLRLAGPPVFTLIHGATPAPIVQPIELEKMIA